MQSSALGQSARTVLPPAYGAPGGYQQYDPDMPGFSGYAPASPQLVSDGFAAEVLAGLMKSYINVAPYFGPLDLLQFMKPGNEQRPRDCPSGTRDITELKKRGLSKDDIHSIKDGVHAEAKHWTGVDPEGYVWTSNNDGSGERHNKYEDYLPGGTRSWR